LATVAEFGNSRRFRRQIVAEIGDYSLQCEQAIRFIWNIAEIRVGWGKTVNLAAGLVRWLTTKADAVGQ